MAYEGYTVLNTGYKMPLLGLGTFQIKSQADVELSVTCALDSGYKLIDTAAVYKNEVAIGACLPKILQEYGMSREDIFITTKLGPQHLGGDAVKGLNESLKNLGVTYVDLYLIHWPGRQGLKQESEENKVLRKEAWLALNEVYQASSKIRSLGVSNYTLQHLKEMESYSKIVPAVVQNEFHPDFQEVHVREYCQMKKIHFQAYSSLGQAKLLCDQRFETTALNHGKSVPQILLRWALQNGCGVIPKSSNPVHIKENINIADFCLSYGEMSAISNCSKNVKFAWNPKGVA